jgi:hypothetical protein
MRQVRFCWHEFQAHRCYIAGGVVALDNDWNKLKTCHELPVRIAIYQIFTNKE